MFAESDLNSSECSYSCRPSGGCRVQYVGAPRGGPTLGSCFPPDFGGSCTGTPPECLHCNLALDCPQGGQEEQEEGEEEGEEEVSGGTGEVCDYKCEENGGCQVLYTGMTCQFCQVSYYIGSL